MSLSFWHINIINAMLYQQCHKVTELISLYTMCILHGEPPFDLYALVILNVIVMVIVFVLLLLEK